MRGLNDNEIYDLKHCGKSVVNTTGIVHGVYISIPTAYHQGGPLTGRLVTDAAEGGRTSQILMTLVEKNLLHKSI